MENVLRFDNRKRNRDWAKTVVKGPVMKELALVLAAQECYNQGHGIPPGPMMVKEGVSGERVLIFPWEEMHQGGSWEEDKTVEALEMSQTENLPMWAVCKGMDENRLRAAMHKVMEMPTDWTYLDENLTPEELEVLIEKAPNEALRTLHQILLSTWQEIGGA